MRVCALCAFPRSVGPGSSASCLRNIDEFLHRLLTSFHRSWNIFHSMAEKVCVFPGGGVGGEGEARGRGRGRGVLAERSTERQGHGGTTSRRARSRIDRSAAARRRDETRGDARMRTRSLLITPSRLFRIQPGYRLYLCCEDTRHVGCVRFCVEYAPRSARAQRRVFDA